MSDSDSISVLSASAHRALFAPGILRTVLEEKVLPVYIPRCRWFSGKARDPRRFSVRDMIAISAGPKAAQLAFVEVEYADGGRDTWTLPLQIATGEEADTLAAAQPGAIVARLADGVIYDAIHDASFRAGLFELISKGTARAGENGFLAAQAGPELAGFAEPPPSCAHAVEQSNSSIIYGDAIFLKLYRRLEAGLNPDAEILRFLSQRGFAHVPPYAGSIEYRESKGLAHVVALGTGLVPNNGDAWSFTLRNLNRWFTALLANDLAEAERIESESLARAGQLGTRTGELHLALAWNSPDPNFAPEPFTITDGQTLAASIAASANLVMTLIESKLSALAPHAQMLAQRFASAERTLQNRIANLATPAMAAKTRTHGDYHLGQVLETGGDFVIIDFEGEPLRPLATRREKRSPFRDVAGMLRSFDYAAHAALESHTADRAALETAATRWSAKAQQAFLEAWLSTTSGALFRGKTAAEENRLLDAFLLEKALYEVIYEINNRPTWLPIPLRGVLGLLQKS